MKFNINRSTFLDAVTRTEKATGKNLSLNILKNILISSKNKTVKLKATNLDIGIEISVSARVERDGIVAVAGDLLYSFITNAPQGEKVSVDASGGILKIKIGNSSASMKVVQHDDFPTIPKVKDGNKLTLPAEVFVKGLRSVWYSASLSSMKPELSSVYVGYKNNAIVFTATDSFRLAEKSIVDKTTKKFESFLIPLKNVGEIIRNLEEVGGETVVQFNENQISFICGETHISSRLIDGTFPDYEQIIPKEYETEAVVLKQDLVQNLKTVNVFSNKFNQIGVEVYPKNKQLKIITQNTDVGESEATVEAAITGEEIDIGFNYKYITDGLQSVTTDSIAMKFSGAGKPLVMSGVGDSSFTYLVMPMNK